MRSLTYSQRLAITASSFLLFAVGITTPATCQSPAIVEFFAGGKLQKGLPLVDYAHELVVIGRDGWMHSIDPRKPETQVRHIEGRYEVATVAEVRNNLRAEFGREFEVLTTKNFLVVQPRGRGERWPRTFEQSHRAFTDYMRKRNVNVRNGRFPMIAIVFPDERAMYQAFEQHGIDVSRVAGLYSGDSNRVMTHDGGRSSSIAATVRHEAAHQSAFNSGVHSRVNDTPRWISEGIGQMFEPAAMSSPLSTNQLADRVNRDSVAFIDRKFDNRRSGELSQSIMQLISDDTMFENAKQVDEAYAVSWIMMFYLAERQPDAFAELLNHTASRPPFQAYDRKARIDDFERIVGTDTLDFSKRVTWFLKSL